MSSPSPLAPPAAGLRIAPLTPAIGAEVSGVDLTQPIDDATQAALMDAGCGTWSSSSVTRS